MKKASILDFIGREEILAGLEERILRKKQHVAINGLPQIGKTQILKELGRRLSALPDGPRVVQTYVYGRPFQDALRDFLSDLTEAFPEASAEDLEAAKATGSDGALLNRFRAVLLHMTENRPLVWLLDEFDMVFGGAAPWTEAQYSAFVRKLLLDEALSGRVICVIASRPALGSMLLSFEQRLNPFVSETIPSFNLKDMDAYYDYLRENICGRDLDRTERMLIRRHCGRYPKLLALAAQRLLISGDDVAEALRRCRESFNSQFRDIVYLMAREEKTAMHSFSSIVRCYFNPTADDGETVERFRALGYVENYRLPGDPLPADDYRYPYMTVSPVFVDYLFRNHLDKTELNDITVPGIYDPRVLLGGLVGVLRKITRDVLAPDYPGRDWNAEVLLGKCVSRGDGKNNDAGKYYEFVFYPDGGKTRIRQKAAYLLSGPVGRIQISAPIVFLTKAYNSSPRSETWLLDPISLSDHANLIIGFASRFAPYFQEALNADLNDPNHSRRSAAQTAFSNLFSTLKDARDGYAHYLYSGQLQPAGTASLQDQHVAELCKKLLRSIYARIYAL